MGPCRAQPVLDFLMREDGAFFPAPFGHLDRLVFALFLEFRAGLVDQGPFHEAGEVDSLGKASPAGGVGVVGAVQHVVQELQLGAGNVLAGLFPPVSRMGRGLGRRLAKLLER